MSDELLTVAQAADYLKLSEKTIRRLIKNCRITASKVGAHSWRIRRKDIDAYFQANINLSMGGNKHAN